MKKLAILILLALEFAVCGCGNSNNSSNTTSTATSGNWEATLIGGTVEASKLNFVTAFSVTNYRTAGRYRLQFHQRGCVLYEWRQTVQTKAVPQR